MRISNWVVLNGLGLGRVEFEAELRGFFKLDEPLVVSMGKRPLEGDFHKLKELMEARAL